MLFLVLGVLGPRAQALALINDNVRHSQITAANMPVPTDLFARPFEAVLTREVMQVRQQGDRPAGPSGIADMFIGIPIALKTSSTPQSGASAPTYIFEQPPTISPVSGEVGTIFTLDLGTVSPAGTTLTGQLTLEGVDVTASISGVGPVFTYTGPQAGTLIWSVEANDGAGGTIQTAAVANVQAATASDTVVDMDGVEITVAGSATSGVDATGRVYVVATESLSVTDILPAPDTIDGFLVGGAQKNPRRLTTSVGSQGYDERTSTDSVAPNYDAALTLNAPFDVDAGDRIVKAIPSFEERGYGEPLNLGYRTLHVVSQPLPDNSVLAPTVGWPDRIGPEYYTVDMPAVLALMRNLPSNDITFPPFSVLMESVDQFAPVFAQNSSTFRGTGYESFMPPGMAGRVISGNGIQYGRDVAETFEIAAVALHHDVYSLAEKEQLLWALIRHGIEWGFPIIGSEFKISADGGHQQFWQFATILALIATGREDEIADFMVMTGGGNWDQFFEISPALIDSDFSAHTYENLPQLWRLRTLGVQPGGALVQVPMAGTDQSQAYIPLGAPVMRDGRVLAYTTSQVRMRNSGTVDVPVDVVPVPGFAAGDVIHFGAPSGAIAPGRHDWAQRTAYGMSGRTGAAVYFSPARGNQYRGLQRVVGQMMSLRAMGYMHPSFSPVWGYIKDVIGVSGPGYPSADNEYGVPVSRFEALDGNSYDFLGSSPRARIDVFDRMAQIYDAVPVAPITVQSIVAPGTPAPGALRDGIVIGLLAGEEGAPVAITGEAGAGSTVQIRVLRQSDDSEVVGWFSAKPTAGMTFNAVLTLPRADDWWRLEMRYAGGSEIFTEETRWAVGYKFLMLGQSQMTILLKGTGLGYEMSPANLGTASFYSWQENNLNGSGEAEQFVMLEAGETISDGLAAFVDQYRILDPVTPIQVVRETVNGTSILDFTDDTRSRRMWSDLTNKTDKYGNDFTAVLENWNTSNQSALEGSEDIDILQGFNAHLSEHTALPTHSLRDTLRAGYVYATMPATRNTKVMNDVDHSSAKITYVNTLGYPVGLPMGDYEIDDAGGPHPHGAGQGNLRYGARLAILAARAADLEAPRNPYFEGTATRSPDGIYIDLPVVLPNGGVLSSPTPANLSGFEVYENGVGYYGTGFTASIFGETSVRLTKDTGTWLSAPQLEVRRSANLQLNDPMDRATEQAIVAGELYESWAGDVAGVGLPLYGTMIDGVWTLDVSIGVDQETAGTGGQALVRHLKSVNLVDTEISTSNRERWAYGVLVDDGQVVPAGTQVLLGAFHAPAWGGGTDFDAFSIHDANGTSVGSVITRDMAKNTPGGFAHTVRALTFVQEGTGLDLRAFTNSRASMTSLLAYRLDGVTLAGSLSGNGSGSVTLTNVPVGSTIVAFGQGEQPIVWGGVIEDRVHAAEFNGATRYQAVALGTGEGTVSVTADGATELVVMALPPV